MWSSTSYPQAMALPLADMLDLYDEMAEILDEAAARKGGETPRDGTGN